MAQEHIGLAQKERTHYKAQCQSCKAQLLEHFSERSDLISVPVHAIPCSISMNLCISFDFAQQVDNAQ